MDLESQNAPVMVYLRTRKEEEGGKFMTEQLQRAIERLQQLPIEEQNAIAERILDELDEREWDKITSTSHVQQALIELADEAEQQEKAGEIEAGGFALE
jgi:predicted metal-dependent hydrolase